MDAHITPATPAASNNESNDLTDIHGHPSSTPTINHPHPPPSPQPPPQPQKMNGSTSSSMHSHPTTFYERVSVLYETWNSEEEAEKSLQYHSGGGDDDVMEADNELDVNHQNITTKFLKRYFDGTKKSASIGRWSLYLRNAILKTITSSSPPIQFTKRLLQDARSLAIKSIDTSLRRGTIEIDQPGLFSMVNGSSILFWLSPWWANPFHPSLHPPTETSYHISLHLPADLILSFPTTHLPPFIATHMTPLHDATLLHANNLMATSPLVSRNLSALLAANHPFMGNPTVRMVNEVVREEVGRVLEERMADVYWCWRGDFKEMVGESLVMVKGGKEDGGGVLNKTKGVIKAVKGVKGSAATGVGGGIKKKKRKARLI
ncbi:hypothetical protein BC829DRAFT_390601 [Chytridium lagenaria]|nr:hypothetical protein BC829DRAFT_390601 [Chytridium lagenaria]